MAKRISTEVQSIVQTKNGTLRTAMPGARNPMIVAMKLTAAAKVPMPLTTRPRAQKSVAAPARERVLGQRRISEPTHGGAPPVAKLK